MARPKQRKIILTWSKDGDNKGIEAKFNFSSEDQDAAATTEQLIDIAIKELQNLKVTGKSRPVIVEMDNLRDTSVDEHQPSAES